MATKAYTDKFLEFRRQARIERPVRLTTNHSNDSDDPLMLTIDNGTEMTSYDEGAAQKRLENVIAPEWMRKIKPIEQSLDTIKMEMNELVKKHTKKLHPTFGTNGNEEDTAIANQTKKITRLMRDAKDQIKSLGVGANLSQQTSYMKDNIQKVLASKLQDIGNVFRRDQLNYQSELQKSTNPKKASRPPPQLGSVGTFDKNVQLDDSDDEDDDISQYDTGFSTQLTDRVETNRIRIAQRMNEIREIAAQVEELGQMFNDIATMVHEQGSLLDRIDYNIESADHSVTQGKKEVTEVLHGEKGFSKRLCFLLLLILVFGAVVIAVVLTKSR